MGTSCEQASEVEQLRAEAARLRKVIAGVVEIAKPGPGTHAQYARMLHDVNALIVTECPDIALADYPATVITRYLSRGERPAPPLDAQALERFTEEIVNEFHNVHTPSSRRWVVTNDGYLAETINGPTICRIGLVPFIRCSPDHDRHEALPATVEQLRGALKEARRTAAPPVSKGEGLKRAMIALDAFVQHVSEEPESPDHGCSLGVTDCDGICMDYAHWTAERRRLEVNLRTAIAGIAASAPPLDAQTLADEIAGYYSLGEPPKRHVTAVRAIIERYTRPLDAEALAEELVTVQPNITGERAELWLAGSYRVTASADVEDVLSAARHIREDVAAFVRAFIERAAGRRS